MPPYTGDHHLPSFRNEGPISNTLSNPPTTSRLSHSSGAILSDNGRSGNSVALVTKGWAMAPPDFDARIGVLTSINSRLAKKFLMECVISERVRRMLAALGLESNSTWRSYGDISSSFWWTGTSCRHGDMSLGSSVVLTVNSPRPVRCGLPVTAMSQSHVNLVAACNKRKKLSWHGMLTERVTTTE